MGKQTGSQCNGTLEGHASCGRTLYAQVTSRAFSPRHTHNQPHHTSNNRLLPVRPSVRPSIHPSRQSRVMWEGKRRKEGREREDGTQLVTLIEREGTQCSPALSLSQSLTQSFSASSAIAASFSPSHPIPSLLISSHLYSRIPPRAQYTPMHPMHDSASSCTLLR